MAAAALDPHDRLADSLQDFDPQSGRHHMRPPPAPVPANILRSRHPNMQTSSRASPQPRPHPPHAHAVHPLHRPSCHFTGLPPTAPATETDCGSSIRPPLLDQEDRFLGDSLEQVEILQENGGRVREEEEEPEEEEPEEDFSSPPSGGGYSPPAWRRLGNGTRDSGFWRGHDDLLGVRSHHHNHHHRHAYDIPGGPGGGVGGVGGVGVSNQGSVENGTLKAPPAQQAPSRDSSPDLSDLDIDLDDEDVLARAIRTRLPTGSVSPDKRRSPSPELSNRLTAPLAAKLAEPGLVGKKKQQQHPHQRNHHCNHHDSTAAAAAAAAAEQSDNYIRFALRAEVQQRTEPIDAVLALAGRLFRATTRSWSSMLFSAMLALLSVSSLRSLFQAPAPRPAGDLVKVAGVARSFEPLIYYSEHAVTQVHDLQATSIAVWDLGETVRTSTMRDAKAIVRDLDALSEAMKTLAIEMTKFFASVDGDIDGILNVMDWAKMHLSRLRQSPPPSTLGAVYDNLHNMLSTAHVLEDPDGAPTRLGRLATQAFGLSNPQREQRMIQLLFNEFLAVLETTVRTELTHSVTLFALFEAVDNDFLNLARTVVRESAAQDEMHADLLSSLWTRILGARASEVRKFEENRQLLRNVREKTVRNKGVLVEHNGRLLTLKAGLESLRSKLVSPLVRGLNSTTLTLEDQIRGLEDVNTYLQAVRQQQKGKVMEMLFSSVPSKSRGGSRGLIDDRGGSSSSDAATAGWF